MGQMLDQDDEPPPNFGHALLLTTRVSLTRWTIQAG
jgi:hypothetical protein